MSSAGVVIGALSVKIITIESNICEWVLCEQ